MNKAYKLFATSSAKELGNSIARELGRQAGALHSETFSDGEKFVSYEETIRIYNSANAIIPLATKNRY